MLREQSALPLSALPAPPDWPVPALEPPGEPDVPPEPPGVVVLPPVPPPGPDALDEGAVGPGPPTPGTVGPEGPGDAVMGPLGRGGRGVDAWCVAPAVRRDGPDVAATHAYAISPMSTSGTAITTARRRQ